MTDYNLTEENLLREFPQILKNSPVLYALARTSAAALRQRFLETSLPTIYSRIDELPETLLDILAYDFKIDWWDPNYTIQQKRDTLKTCWLVHKKKGTKAAVQTALSSVYPDAQVQEWFDYGGEPYHFRISLNTTNGIDTDSTQYRRALHLVNYYKNLRSHLDGIFFHASTNALTPGLHFGASIRVHTFQRVATLPALRSEFVAAPILRFGAGIRVHTFQHFTAAPAYRNNQTVSAPPEPLFRLAAAVRVQTNQTITANQTFIVDGSWGDSNTTGSTWGDLLQGV